MSQIGGARTRRPRRTPEEKKKWPTKFSIQNAKYEGTYHLPPPVPPEQRLVRSDVVGDIVGGDDCEGAQAGEHAAARQRLDDPELSPGSGDIPVI